MQSNSIFIAHPTTTEQLKALKAVVKAFKVKFELKKEANYYTSKEVQALVLDRIKTDTVEDLEDWDTAKKTLKRK